MYQIRQNSQKSNKTLTPVMSQTEYWCLLYLSISTRGVIGQFCRPYFTVRPGKLQLISFPARPINLRDVTNILLARSASYGSSFFPVDLWPGRINQRGKNSVRNLQYGPRTRLVRGMKFQLYQLKYVFFSFEVTSQCFSLALTFAQHNRPTVWRWPKKHEHHMLQYSVRTSWRGSFRVGFPLLLVVKGA